MADEDTSPVVLPMGVRVKRSPMPRRTARLERITKLRAKGGSRFPKQRDRAYTNWIKTLPCTVTSRSPWWLIDERVEPCFGPIDPAHVNKTRAQGAPDLGQVVPLCRGHHDEQEGRTARFDRRYHLKLEKIAADLASQYAAQRAANEKGTA